ncbi:MAG: GreA/GreB family elongation factor [Jatrophihabitans sp.]
MTATLDPDARHRALTERLAALQAEREQARAETAPTSSGDDADRATNVEAHLRMAMLDQQIATVELELLAGVHHHRKDPRTADTAEIGDVVTVDFGDGPEQFLLASVEQSGDGLDVITPTSPLGQAILGARAGTTVHYKASRRSLEARLVSVAA